MLLFVALIYYSIGLKDSLRDAFDIFGCEILKIISYSSKLTKLENESGCENHSKKLNFAQMFELMRFGQ